MQKLPSESETPGASPSCAFPGLQHSTVLLQSAPAHRTPRASSARSVTAYLLMDIPLFQRAHIVPKAILRAAVRVEALPAVAYPAPALRSRLNPEQMHLKTRENVESGVVQKVESPNLWSLHSKWAGCGTRGLRDCRLSDSMVRGMVRDGERVGFGSVYHRSHVRTLCPARQRLPNSNSGWSCLTTSTVQDLATADDNLAIARQEVHSSHI